MREKCLVVCSVNKYFYDLFVFVIKHNVKIFGMSNFNSETCL